jgi:hypothetical protein
LSGLAVLFLPAWAIKSTPSPSLPSPGTLPEDRRGMPYLRVIGPTPLRFEDAPIPPPDLVTRPVAGGPPQPAAPVAPAAGTPPPPSPAAGQNQASPPAPGQLSATPPVPILPDETRPKVQPEDFLPFFQFPAAPGDVIAPAATNPSDRPPPSSASYRKQ